MTFCPDCGKQIPSDLFIAHREMEHPPSLQVVSAVGGIKSQTAFGTDPKE